MKIEPADETFFREAACWRYPPPYDFYDGDQGPVKNPERFFALRRVGALIGFYYFERKGDALEYWLGLRPELTGRGLGKEFSRAGLEFGRARFRPKKIIQCRCVQRARDQRLRAPRLLRGGTPHS